MPFVSDLLSFAIAYGYLATFIASFFEGESILLSAGLLAQQDHLSFSKIVFFAFLGAMAGDTAWFLLGRYKGRQIMSIARFLSRWFSRPAVIIAKNPRKVAITMRFMYGLRHVVPFGLGMSNLPFRVFFALDAVGAMLWVGLFSSAGYFLGDFLGAVFGKLKKYDLVLIIVVLLLVALAHSVFRLLVGLARQKLEEDRQKTDDGR